jgi:hypothetical protein
MPPAALQDPLSKRLPNDTKESPLLLSWHNVFVKEAKDAGVIYLIQPLTI